MEQALDAVAPVLIEELPPAEASTGVPGNDWQRLVDMMNERHSNLLRATATCWHGQIDRSCCSG